jgi:hypothetical protein
MFKSLKKRIFPFIIAVSALAVSGSAAFYSVSGLSKLFAGAELEVVIMASSLEFSKLVIASLLYQYWGTLNKVLKVYLTIAAGVLILITSMGIYGFLSNAYIETANKAKSADSQITLLDSKKLNLVEQREILTEEKSETIKNITDLRKGLTNNTQTTKDRSGNILISSSSANRATFEKQLNKAIERQEQINVKLDSINSEIYKLESEVIETQISNEAASELGPLIYLSNLTGTPMDVIINWLLLVIIFVFDPLAIALVIAANFAFKQIQQPTYKNPKHYSLYNPSPLPISPTTNPQPPQPEPLIDTPISEITVSEFNKPKESSIEDLFSTWKKNKLRKKEKDNNDIIVY